MNINQSIVAITHFPDQLLKAAHYVADEDKTNKKIDLKLKTICKSIKEAVKILKENESNNEIRKPAFDILKKFGNHSIDEIEMISQLAARCSIIIKGEAHGIIEDINELLLECLKIVNEPNTNFSPLDYINSATIRDALDPEREFDVFAANWFEAANIKIHQKGSKSIKSLNKEHKEHEYNAFKKKILDFSKGQLFNLKDKSSSIAKIELQKMNLFDQYSQAEWEALAKWVGENTSQDLKDGAYPDFHDFLKFFCDLDKNKNQKAIDTLAKEIAEKTVAIPNEDIKGIIKTHMDIDSLLEFSKTNKQENQISKKEFVKLLNEEKVRIIDLNLFSIEKVIKYLGIENCRLLKTLNIAQYHRKYMKLDRKSRDEIFDIKPEIMQMIIQHFPNLEHLNLSPCEIDDETAQEIGKLTKLNKLNLDSCMKIENLNFLKNLSNLKHLSFSHCRSKEYDSLENLELQYINISFSKIKSFPDLKYPNSLKNLELAGCNKIKSFDFISNLKELEVLDLALNDQITNLDFLINSELVQIYLDNCGNLTNTDGLKNCKKLKIISLEDCRNANLDLNVIRELKNLKKFNISDIDLNRLDDDFRMFYQDRFCNKRESLIDEKIIAIQGPDHLY